MTRVRRSCMALCVGVAAVAAVFVPAPTQASAAQLGAAGWWWRASQGPLAAPAPPTVPDGGLMVGGAPDGPTAVAAVRYSLGDGEAAPVLTLKVAQGSEVNGSSGIVVACPSAAPWKPASAGSWDARPSADCGSGSVPGVRSADGTTYTFDLSSLVHDGVLDVVFSPGKPVDPIPASPTFQVAWERPGPEAITQSSQVTDTGSGTPDSSFAAPDASGSAAGAAGDAGAAGSSGGGSDFSLPSSSAPVPSGDAGAAAGVGAPVPSDEQVAAAPGGGPRLSHAPRAARRASTSHRPVRPLAVIVLLLALGIACALALQPPPPPRQLSRFAAGPRVGTPPPLV